jgi:hypothetical protein
MRHIITLLLMLPVLADAQIYIDSYRFGCTLPLLDCYPGAEAAYSLRKLDNDYTGNCIMVRRSSNNDSLNIGFSGNYLDTAALITFCAATDCFVRTWYDQTGNANHARQTLNSSQPQIVSSGNINYADNKAGILFGLNDTTGLVANTLVSLFDSLNMPFSAFVAAKKTSDATVGLILRAKSSTSGSPIQSIGLLDLANGGKANYFTRNQSNTSIASSATNVYNFNFNLYGWLYSGSTINFYANGVANGSVSHTNAVTTYSADRFYIGNDLLPGAGRGPFVGTISEIIAYPFDQSSDRAAIETNINTFYSIY